MFYVFYIFSWILQSYKNVIFPEIFSSQINSNYISISNSGMEIGKQKCKLQYVNKNILIWARSRNDWERSIPGKGVNRITGKTDVFEQGFQNVVCLPAIRANVS